MFHPLPIIGGRLFSVEPIHREIERLVRLSQIWRHQVWVVQVGKGSTRMSGAGIENGLGSNVISQVGRSQFQSVKYLGI